MSPGRLPKPIHADDRRDARHSAVAGHTSSSRLVERRSREPVGGLDLGREPIEIGDVRFVVPDLYILKEIGVHPSLVRTKDNSYRQIGPRKSAIPLDDCAVLWVVEVQSEHHTMSRAELRTALAAEQRAQLLHLGTVTHDRGVAAAFEKRDVERFVGARCDIKQDNAFVPVAVTRLGFISALHGDPFRSSRL